MVSKQFKNKNKGEKNKIINCVKHVVSVVNRLNEIN